MFSNITKGILLGLLGLGICFALIFPPPFLLFLIQPDSTNSYLDLIQSYGLPILFCGIISPFLGLIIGFFSKDNTKILILFYGIGMILALVIGFMIPTPLEI